MAYDAFRVEGATMDHMLENPLLGRPLIRRDAGYDALDHYRLRTGPIDEFGDLPETLPTPRNIGWTLGNDCPYRCTHCYSMNAREKGMDMSVAIVDRIVEQLRINGVETVNLGGNEPLFTNGANPKTTLLPYIIQRLVGAGIIVGLTTSGITILRLYRDHRGAFDLLNDVDVSLDSPDPAEHNKNRGANIYHQAIEALEICQRHNKPHSIIMCGMSWNFTIPRLDELIALAIAYDANIRINPLKPVQPQHMEVALSPSAYYAGFSHLMRHCSPVDLGEPPLAAVTNFEQARRCPCGRTSFRIHSITPAGEIFVSPCVYLHDYKSEFDLIRHELADIIHSPQFRVFRQRNANPDRVAGCEGCSMLQQCGGGCAGRAYLHELHQGLRRTMTARDPYCPVREQGDAPFPQRPVVQSETRLVHMDYLCTWIGRPMTAST